MSTADAAHATRSPDLDPATRDVAAPSSFEGSGVIQDVPYRFSVADFYRMIDLDIFPTTRRVGLWDGQVYEKMAKKFPHAMSGGKVARTLIRLQPPGWSAWPENPITLGPDLAPLPDMCVIRGELEDYRHHPEAADVVLIVELSDSSLRLDTRGKLAAYAKAGIPTYWVVNLIAQVVQVYEGPAIKEGRYASATTFARGEMIPLVLDGVAVGPIAVADLLPPP